MQCPKCGGFMRTYERNGVTVDQCEGCRGLFLDHGELERLSQLESSMYQPTGGGHYSRGPGWGAPGYGRKRRREGMFGMLFSS